jgi:NAD(P)H dehydrogenase (quinone)
VIEERCLNKILVCYDSRTGHTESMAQCIAEGARGVPGVEVQLRKVGDTNLDHLVEADGIVLGAPTYFGQMSGPMKHLMDESIEVYGKLNDKVGGAFCSAGVAGGGGETAVMSLILALLSHKMIVVGDPEFTLGPLAIGEPDAGELARCRKYGARVAEISKKLHST